MPFSVNIERLERVSSALGNLADEMLFTGGSSVELYLERPAKTQIRPTKDVDCITKVITRTDFDTLEKRLRALGFTDAGLTAEKGPQCRFTFEDILIDFIPLDEKVFGFSNRWFPEAFLSPLQSSLPSGRVIKLPSLPCFLAIKLETMLARGGEDLRDSWDLEDIIVVLDSLLEPSNALQQATQKVRDFVQQTLSTQLKDPYFAESVESCSPSGFEQAQRVLEILTEISSGKTPSTASG